MEIEDIRKILDEQDSKMFETLSIRMSYIKDVAEYKLAHNLCMSQPQREEEIVFKRREQAAGLGVNPDLVEEVMRVIIKYALQQEEEIASKDPRRVLR